MRFPTVPRTSIIHRPVAPRWFDGGSDVNLEDPKVLEAIQAAVKSATEGLESELAKVTGNRQRILDEKRALEGELKEFKEQWQDLDPEAVRGLLKQVSEDEEKKLIAQGKLDEVINNRVESLRADLESKVKAGVDRIGELEGVESTLRGRIKQLVLGGKIREAATKIEGFAKTAIPDAELAASSVFELDDDENPIARGPDGVTRMGKDGKSPLGPEEWLASQIEGPRPHWREPSAGGGATGGGTGDGARSADDAARVEGMSSRQKLMVGLEKQAAAQ